MSATFIRNAYYGWINAAQIITIDERNVATVTSGNFIPLVEDWSAPDNIVTVSDELDINLRNIDHTLDNIHHTLTAIWSKLP
jgi:hypothetical protein